MASTAGVVLAALAAAGAQGSVGAVASESAPHGALLAGGTSVHLFVSEAQSAGVPSPDSRNLYVAAGYDGRSRVIVVRRDPVSGRLAKLKSGCSLHCSYADGLNNPVDLAVTPDGLDVIVGSRRSRLSVYRRTGEGRLRMVSCFGWQLHRTACPSSPIKYYPKVAVSPDSRHLYVASFNGQRRLDLLARDARTGRLRVVAGLDGCFLWALAPNDQCRFTINTGFRPRDVTISPDGRTLFVFGGGGFYVFNRDVESGRLTLLPGRTGCYLSRPTANCTLVRDFYSTSATSVRVPRDGRHAYFGRRVFRRNASTGVLALLSMRVPEHIQFSPDGLTAYQGGSNLRVYRRNKSGALTLLPQPFGILRGLGIERSLFNRSDGVTVMPDGRHVYLTGERTTRMYRVAG